MDNEDFEPESDGEEEQLECQVDKMEKSLEELKIEAERERADRYLNKFGGLKPMKEEERSLKEFN